MRKARIILAAVLAAGMLFSCGKENPIFKDFNPDSEGSTFSRNTVDRDVTPETRRVHILYSAGYNSLNDYLREDIDDFTKGYVPENTRNSDVLLVISRLPQSYKDYNTPTSPVLIRLTMEEGKETERDTVKVWEPDNAASSVTFMREALQFVKDTYPAAGYGMVFSSHGSGWLPPRYYANPTQFDPYDGNVWYTGKRGVRYYGFPEIPEYPAVKSLGQDEGTPYSEIEIQDLTDAFPMHLDYLVLDACLMGCVEVAYELRNVCDVLAFSQAEVLADGFDYSSLAARLMEKPKPNVEGVCSDYFDYYNSLSGAARSATISMVNCKAMDNLADVCATLFSKYQTQLQTINPDAVQRYFRSERHYFYDLQDILLHCGINDEEKAMLQEALDASIIYKAATPRFLNTFDITVYSGFSMFLPSACTRATYLNNYYRTSISWNTRTGLLP